MSGSAAQFTLTNALPDSIGFLVKALDDQFLADAGFAADDDIEPGLGHPVDDLPNAAKIFA